MTDETKEQREARQAQEHFEKYDALAVAVGVVKLADHIVGYGITREKVEAALASNDEYLNKIALNRWDRAALNESLVPVLRVHGPEWPGLELTRTRDKEPWKSLPSTMSLGERVCLLKHVAGHYVAGGKVDEIRKEAERLREENEAAAERKWKRSVDSRVYEGADIIDSRDVILRIQQLQDEYDELKDEVTTEEARVAELEVDAQSSKPDYPEGRLDEALAGLNAAKEALSEFEDDEDRGGELKKLKELKEAAEDSADWEHGETLISDDYFETYAEELADDIGAIDKDAGWPTRHIDWKAAADELKQDYTSVEYGETTYWIRS